MKPTDAAWLAGLFEGEGCFRIMRNKGVCALISMTDRDVIEHVFTLMPSVKIRRIPPTSGRVKAQYVWSIDNETQVREFIALVKPWLGSRRSAKADELLLHLDTRPERRRHFNREKTHCVHGHRFSPANTYIQLRTGARSCLICRRSATRHRRERRREQRVSV